MHEVFMSAVMLAMVCYCDVPTPTSKRFAALHDSSGGRAEAGLPVLPA